MDCKDILVFLDASADIEARPVLAIALAEAHRARLRGVDVTPPAVLEGRWSDQVLSQPGIPAPTFH